MYDTISDNPSIQAFYERMRMCGESHNTAEMLALAQPPGLTGTERAFLEGRCNGNQFEGQQEVGDMYAEDALAAGVSTKGKIYHHSLARFPGDPRAWISSRHDAKRIVEEEGWGAQGSFNVAPRNVAEPTGGGLADSLVDEHTQAAIAASPEPVKDVAELREQVKEKLTPHWAT